MLQGFSSIINYDVQSKSIKRALSPLADQVALISSLHDKKKGVKSKKMVAQAKHVNEVCYALIKVARDVGKDHPEVQHELSQACNRTQDVCNIMRVKIEGGDKNDASGSIIDIARQLVNNVARILIVMDSADLIMLEKCAIEVKHRLREVQHCEDICMFDDVFHKLKTAMDTMMKQIAARQADLLDAQKRDDLALVRAMWRRCEDRLKTSSRVASAHIDLESGILNRNLVIDEINESMRKLHLVIKGRSSSESTSKSGSLAASFEEFEVNVIFVNKMAREQYMMLRNTLGEIVKGATTIAESANTREERQVTIHRLCRDCQSVLEFLINPNSSTGKDSHIERICKLSDELKHNLQLAVLDHIDDFYFLPHIPFQVLYNVTAEGARNKDAHKESEDEMAEHVLKLERIAKMACSLSTESFHIKVVRMALSNFLYLFRQVVYATRSLANQPKDELIKRNMDVYKNLWTTQLNTLVEAVDEICPASEFLYISSCHAQEDVETIAMVLETESIHGPQEDHNWADLDQKVDALVNRTYRVLGVILEERRKVVDERFLSNDPVVKRTQHIIRVTLNDAKKVCNEIVSQNKTKYDDMKMHSNEILGQLTRLQVEFTKATSRFDAYLEQFRSEIHSTEHELSRHSNQNDKFVDISFKICGLLKVVAMNIDHENCLQLWSVVLRKLEEVSAELGTLDALVKDLIGNSRVIGSKSDVVLRYSSKMCDCARHAVREASRDFTASYVCYGAVFVSIISSAKSIVSSLRETHKGCLQYSSKRKKVFKK